MKNNELLIPPAALEDHDAFEILRLWAAGGEQHVTIRPDLLGGPHDFGYMLAQLLQHGARLYAQREGIDLDRSRKKILSGFQDELENPTGEATGSIPIEH